MDDLLDIEKLNAFLHSEANSEQEVSIHCICFMVTATFRLLIYRILSLSSKTSLKMIVKKMENRFVTPTICLCIC